MLTFANCSVEVLADECPPQSPQWACKAQPCCGRASVMRSITSNPDQSSADKSIVASTLAVCHAGNSGVSGNPLLRIVTSKTPTALVVTSAWSDFGSEAHADSLESTTKRN